MRWCRATIQLCFLHTILDYLNARSFYTLNLDLAHLDVINIAGIDGTAGDCCAKTSSMILWDTTLKRLQRWDEATALSSNLPGPRANSNLPLPSCHTGQRKRSIGKKLSATLTHSRSAKTGSCLRNHYYTTRDIFSAGLRRPTNPPPINQYRQSYSGCV